MDVTYALDAPLGVLSLSTQLFPYDPVHQTFVNVYERDALMLQAILTKDRQQLEYFAGTRQGTLAVMRKFLPSGMHHILIGPDHLFFLVGLLLLGGSLRQLVLVVSAFTLAHSVTLSLAALNIVTPPAWIVEPAIALSIVYVGADNLTVRDGRDVRVWIAFGFGLIHGFGFANVLREMDLPARALGWSLFAFNLGVEVGQLPWSGGRVSPRGHPREQRSRGQTACGRRLRGRDRGWRVLVHRASLRRRRMNRRSRKWSYENEQGKRARKDRS